MTSACLGGQRVDNAMKTRVQAFQLAQGLKPDGLAGPTTFMQLTRATAAPGAGLAPRLTGAH